MAGRRRGSGSGSARETALPTAVSRASGSRPDRGAPGSHLPGVSGMESPLQPMAAISPHIFPRLVYGPERRATFVVPPGAPPEHLLRSLIGAYLSGAELFEIQQIGGISAEVHGIVRTFVRRTIEPEVLVEEPDRIELRDVSDTSRIPLLRRVGRMGQLVVALHKDAGASWGRLPRDSGYWESRDDEVDRQAWFIERSSVRLLEQRRRPARGTEEVTGPLGYWLVARTLERIADHAVRIGEAGSLLGMGRHQSAPLESLHQFHDQAIAHLGAVLENLATCSGGRANELLDTGEALHLVRQAWAERLIPESAGASSLAPSTAVALSSILESIDRTIAYSQDIAEATLGFASELAVADSRVPAR